MLESVTKCDREGEREREIDRGVNGRSALNASTVRPWRKASSSSSSGSFSCAANIAPRERPRNLLERTQNHRISQLTATEAMSMGGGTSPMNGNGRKFIETDGRAAGERVSE